MDSEKQQDNDSWSQSWDFVKDLPKIISVWIEKRFGRKVAFIFISLIIVGSFLFIFPGKTGQFISGIKDIKSIWETSPFSSTSPQFSPKPMVSQTPLDEERIKGIVAHPCDGLLVEIISEFKEVEGSEKLIYTDDNDHTVVAAPDSGTFQGVKRYQFDCSLPWIATFSAIPRKEESIGIFLEFEEVFRIIIGDGDRISWKIEKNDSGRKEKWTEVTRRKLSYGKITPNKQITVTLEASYKAGFIYLIFKINYLPEGELNYGWLEYKDILFQPLAINLENSFNQSQKFRIGINDSRFKGRGSEIKFGKFSVKTIR